MQLNKDKLNKLLSLSEDELKEKITDAVMSGSFNQKDKENFDKALKNMKDIKKTLGNIDEESIKKAMNSLGEDNLGKIEELKKNLKK